ncbi:hypothetical protein RUE5091_00898 [Ruegeria denitrificans]|uniref:Uncharacterized protein n=1 Tax=Ruegeria denitrificans TaxID=1715692 RepID=A0A0N7M8P8_9RHOB|nr:hypothetical protein [Ruegeria denitrificans]CUJ89607.1 hypothetical protein RUE5091_00898 [Ruegeria denitrificans]
MKKFFAAPIILASLIASTASAEDLVFLLGNESSVDLVEFNVSVSESDNWESNLLQGDYIAPGYEADVLIADGLTTCVYDVRGGFSDGSSAEEYGVDLCDLGEYVFTD